jgi:hypothetical protein
VARVPLDGPVTTVLGSLAEERSAGVARDPLPAASDVVDATLAFASADPDAGPIEIAARVWALL